MTTQDDRQKQPDRPLPPQQVLCQECGRTLPHIKCANCVVNDLPEALIRFGEIVKREAI